MLASIRSTRNMLKRQQPNMDVQWFELQSTPPWSAAEPAPGALCPVRLEASTSWRNVSVKESRCSPNSCACELRRPCADADASFARGGGTWPGSAACRVAKPVLAAVELRTGEEARGTVRPWGRWSWGRGYTSRSCDSSARREVPRPGSSRGIVFLVGAEFEFGGIEL